MEPAATPLQTGGEGEAGVAVREEGAEMTVQVCMQLISNSSFAVLRPVSSTAHRGRMPDRY